MDQAPTRPRSGGKTPDLASLRKENQRLLAELESERGKTSSLSEELSKLRSEKDRLAEQLQRSQEELARVEWELWNRVPDVSEAEEHEERWRELERSLKEEKAKLEIEVEELRETLADLFASEEFEAQRKDTVPDYSACLAGKRVLLVGGIPKVLPEMRSAIESLGATLVYDEGWNAAQAASKVNGADIVVFAIHKLGHSVYERVKSTAKARGVQVRHWGTRSPESLKMLLMMDSPQAMAS